MNVSIREIKSPPLDLNEIHVLAVDDSLIDRIVIERLLRITSCKVTAVDSGWRALEFLGLDNEKDEVDNEKASVDLIITDYCMPGMTGYELLKKIKESSNFREVPVVIMSSENVLTRIDRCLEEGAEDFLLKPVKLADVKRLRNHLTNDVKVSNGNKRKLSEDSVSVNSSLPPPSPPSNISESDSSPLIISESSDSSQSSPSLTISESSDSSPPVPSSPEEPPIRRQKMKSP